MTNSDSGRDGAIVPVDPSAAKSLLDGLPKCRLTQCDIPFPLQLDHFRLIDCDRRNLEAHDDFSVALHKASRPRLILVRPRGHGLSIVEHLRKLLAVGNPSQEI